MLIGCSLVRNEAGRYLEKVLDQMRSVCDKIVVLDDCSTDETPEICRKYGAEVFYSERSYWGTNELRQRKFLWELATHEAEDGDWILCLDADETISNIQYLPENIEMAEQLKGNGIGFKLHDMWSGTHYRSDELWNAHERVWIMCVRYDQQKGYIWRETNLHCGRFPINACGRILSTLLTIQHLGWSRPEDREAKYRRYMEADPEGKNGNLAQYRSILDPNPTLKEFVL